MKTYKCPIYATKPFNIPKIPSDLACQRNLPGVISHPSYPFCAIIGVNTTEQISLMELKMKEESIAQITDKTSN